MVHLFYLRLQMEAYPLTSDHLFPAVVTGKLCPSVSLVMSWSMKVNHIIISGKEVGLSVYPW